MEISQKLIADFIENGKYYKANNHQRLCKICALPMAFRMEINKMILDDESNGKIYEYLINNLPHIFNELDRTHILRVINSHREYLPLLLEDVQIKSMFKRARTLLENKQVDKMHDFEKVKLITEVEAELMKEYGDFEGDRISFLTVIYKTTLPLLLERLHNEILSDGKASDIRSLTEASNTIFKISSAITMPVVGNESKDIDYEDDDIDNKQRVVSLSDKIKKSIGG